MPLPTPAIISQTPLRARIAATAVLGIVIIAALIAVFMLVTADDQPADAADRPNEQPTPPDTAEADIPTVPVIADLNRALTYIEQNRNAINQLTVTFGQNAQQLAILNEQINAVLQNQQQLNPESINQRATILEESLRQIDLALEQTRQETAAITSLQNSIKQLESQLAAAAGQQEQQTDQSDQTIAALRSEIAALHADLDPISQRIDDLEIRLDNLPTLPAETQTIHTRLAECRVSQLARPPDQHFDRQQLVDRFSAVYRTKLEAGAISADELERQLEECERSLW